MMGIKETTVRMVVCRSQWHCTT